MSGGSRVMFKVGRRDVVVKMKLAARDQVMILFLDPWKLYGQSKSGSSLLTPSTSTLLNLLQWC